MSYECPPIPTQEVYTFARDLWRFLTAWELTFPEGLLLHPLIDTTRGTSKVHLPYTFIPKLRLYSHNREVERSNVFVSRLACKKGVTPAPAFVTWDTHACRKVVFTATWQTGVWFEDFRLCVRGNLITPIPVCAYTSALAQELHIWRVSTYAKKYHVPI